MTENRNIQRETQQQKIIRVAQEVFETSAAEADELAFMSKCFIQATLPHSDPGDVPMWGRRGGNYSLSIQPGMYLDEDNNPVNMGIPYGSIPRLILAWLNGEVIKTDSREVLLGRSFSEFLGKMGYASRGGVRGEYARVRSQAQKLFASRITMVTDRKASVPIPQPKFSMKNANVTDEANYFWDPIRPEQCTLWESNIRLSEPFFAMLKAAPVPLDWRVLKAIKQSPMALDLYMFLTYRMFSLQNPQAIKWKTLSKQLGSEYKNIRHFRAKIKANFPKIKAIWQDLNVDLSDEESIILSPSRLLIAPKE